MFNILSHALFCFSWLSRKNQALQVLDIHHTSSSLLNTCAQEEDLCLNVMESYVKRRFIICKW